MKETLVVDASIVIKWLVPEQDWAVARRLFQTHRLIAPELLLAECANILWKKSRRRELTPAEAFEAAEEIKKLEVGFEPLGDLIVPATELAAHLDHPAYDCFYLALAIVENTRLVTADERFLRVVEQNSDRSLWAICRSLQDF